MSTNRKVLVSYAIIGATLVLLVVMNQTGEPAMLAAPIESALEYLFQAN